MRINYNVLWIEDETKWLKPARDLINDIIEENGFRLQEKVLSSETEAVNYITNNDLHVYDLILVDFRLDDNPVGNVLIERIRSYGIFTEVVFYSSDLEKIREVIHKQMVDGVYCANRETDQFIDKFEKVFLTTVRKAQDISAVRGLVIAEASENDEILLEIIRSFLKGENTIDQREELIAKVCENREEQLKEMKAYTPDNVDQMLGKLSAMERLNAVQRLIKQKRKTDKLPEFLKDECDILNVYNAEIIKTRNDLAHCVETWNENQKPILRTWRGEREFSEEEFTGIRKNMIKHSENLRRILAQI